MAERDFSNEATFFVSSTIFRWSPQPRSPSLPNTLLVLNASSILPKISELREVVASSKPSPDILAITETWLSTCVSGLSCQPSRLSYSPEGSRGRTPWRRCSPIYPSEFALLASCGPSALDRISLAGIPLIRALRKAVVCPRLLLSTSNIRSAILLVGVRVVFT